DLEPNLPGCKVFDKAVIAPDTNDAEEWFQGTNFTGVLDGSNHTISHLTISGESYLGLFGQLGSGATISNLALESVNINGTGLYVGGLVGRYYGGSITSSSSTGSVSGDDYVGGLVGGNGGSITSSSSTGSVSGDDDVGGLVGLNDGGITSSYSTGSVNGHRRIGGLVGNNLVSISDCYSNGTVTGYEDVGGLVGGNAGFAHITTSYSTGTVTGNDNVGGLVGFNEGSITSSYSTGTVAGNNNVGGLMGSTAGGWLFLKRISNNYSTGTVDGVNVVGGLVGSSASNLVNCYSIGIVIGESDVGALIGHHQQGEIDSCVWDVQTSGQLNMCGSQEAGATGCDDTFGLTTSDMQTAITFVDWGCDPVWTIDEGRDYPRLWWENAPGEPITVQLLLGDGMGTQAEPYLIYTADQLNSIGMISCALDKHFKLMADIDLSSYAGTSFNMIGTGDDAFSGVFDGNGRTILDFSYTSTETDYVGVFGYVHGPNAEIKNLGLIDPNVDSEDGRYVGSLVGYLESGTISNCYIEGGSVSGAEYVGGLVGRNRGSITSSYSTGTVSGDDNVGGLVGYHSGTIANCYSAGAVTGGEYVGGLVGRKPSWATVTVSFWDIETSGVTWSNGGMGVTTAEMQQAETFLCWGYEAVWTIDEGADYPRFRWENKPGQPIETRLSDFLAGEGTKDDPYLIYTAEQFNTIGMAPCDWDKHFKLMADIDLSAYSGIDYNPIGYWLGSSSASSPFTDGFYWLGSSSAGSPFTGVFDGNDKKILNLSGTRPLFEYVSGTIKGLGLIDPNVTAIGSLVGINSGTISDCYAEGGSVLGSGGLVGENSRGTITNCHSSVSVSGDEYVGGLVGENRRGTITDCHSTGNVFGQGDVGGLVGHNVGWWGSWADAAVLNCYSTGSVTGTAGVGGLVGSNARAVIIGCYSTGNVQGQEGSEYLGGLVGTN
ncbi:MAG: GLUG motif-containing protein, partial [Planctomycetota bacterium]